MSDRAVQVVRASEAEELLPRAAADRSSAVCRGGMSGGEWHRRLRLAGPLLEAPA